MPALGLLMAVLVMLGGVACSGSSNFTSDETTESIRLVEQAIRREIGKPDGPITDADRMGLTELHLTNTAVTDLTPLTDLRNLQGLSLSGCARVSDLTPLEKLTHLVYLDLAGCTAITEIPSSLGRRNGLKIVGP